MNTSTVKYATFAYKDNNETSFEMEGYNASITIHNPSGFVSITYYTTYDKTPETKRVVTIPPTRFIHFTAHGYGNSD